MKLIPSNNIKAEIGFLEFHNTKGSLGAGTYQVTEADGETSYAVIGQYGALEWFSEREYEDAIQGQAYNQSLDDRLDGMWTDAMHRDHHEFSRVDAMQFVEDVTDTEFNRYVSDVYANSEFDSHAFDDSMEAVSDMAAEKTLGQLLREQMASHSN